MDHWSRHRSSSGRSTIGSRSIGDLTDSTTNLSDRSSGDFRNPFEETTSESEDDPEFQHVSFLYLGNNPELELASSMNTSIADLTRKDDSKKRART